MARLSKTPESSPITSKTFIIGLDWLKWFQELAIFVVGLLNKYDNGKSGVGTLIAGTKVVSNIKVQATSYIRLTAQNVSGTAGFLSVVLNPGVGFTINSSNVADTRTIFYEIVEAL